MLISFLVLVTNSATVVNAAAYDSWLPRATPIDQVVAQWSPTITPSPQNGQSHLFRRQASGDDTCAWVSGLTRKIQIQVT